MADSSSGRNIAGARRVPSAALSEDYYNFVRSGGNGGAPGAHHGPQQQHSLRPMESRFSLREQFSTTRREIDFGFDDTSSIYERSILASEADVENELEDTVVVNEGSSFMPPPPRPSHNPPIQRSHYELLCLPNDPSLTPNDIRRAFHRVVQNLCVDRQPQRLQLAAASYLGQVQIAFETLIEPYKRAEYDMSLAEKPKKHSESSTSDQDAAAYQASLLEQYVLLGPGGPGGLRTTTDLGMRVDARSMFDSTRKDRILDLSLRQSITTKLSALQEPLENIVRCLPILAERTLDLQPTNREVHRVNPTLTITGSTHGLLDEPFKLGSVLRDPYQPPGPSIHGRRRLEQLLFSRFLPGLHMAARQELFTDKGNATPYSVLEQELEILPFPSVTLRAGQSLVIPDNPTEPLNIEVSVQKPLISSSSSSLAAATSPTIGLALDKKLGPGTAFLVVDGGNSWPWTSTTTGDMECRQLSKFSEMTSSPSTGRFIQKMNSQNANHLFHNARTVEIGYAFEQHANVMGLSSGSEQAFTRPSERGLRGLDRDVSLYGCHDGSITNSQNSGGSWTVSTGLTFGTVAGYLRYGKDLLTSPPSSTTITASSSSQDSSRGSDILLAFRTLKYIGRFTKIGLELAVTTNNLHLSIYWSRLGQRMSIPFLLVAGGGARSSGKLVFLISVLPFTALAIWDGFLKPFWRARKARVEVFSSSPDYDDSEIEIECGTMEVEAELVAQRRAEADELTVILATGVEGRQRGERQRGGLVILSAKYGVLLHIPAGLDKGRLLGFWDPAAPTWSLRRDKTLWIRYLYRGRESVVEVGAGEAVCLP
ncbi:hypothetical protein QBC37DRAFT_279147 [Rhypophila decipiens]|uniref:J domain-containing protein n=1 Tax=Rhypophila decipiens TaxID=261697 RepID=A0AAN6YEG5_9PEZI|nr:hypothetical protein QBC37DRAFT_279147 [Rhypophila decipiens]